MTIWQHGNDAGERSKQEVDHMKYGIYYAYWERQWGADYLKYIKKVGKTWV